MWCSKRMDKISWTDGVRNEKVLHRVKKTRNILRTIKGKNSNWTGHILRRNCLLKHVAERNIRVTGKRGQRRQRLLYDHKETR
jgi:hypothetical protein